MDYKLNYEKYSGVFAVPNCITDEFIAQASGMYIKVLLLLIRHCDDKLTPLQISKKANLSLQDVNESISYWAAQGMITDITASCNNSDKTASSSDVPEVPEVSQQASNVQIISPKPSKIALGNIGERIDKDENLRFLLTQSESMMGRSLNSTEQRVFIYIYEETRMPADVILMAVDFCLKRGKSSIRYIRTVCESWADLGISDHGTADAHIKELTEKDSHYNKIKTIFGIKERNLSAKEKAYTDVWFGEYNTASELLERAYDICVDATGKLSFPYIDKILKNWKDDGVTEVKDTVKPSGKQKKPVKDRIVKETSFDIDEFEARGINFVKRK